jgi:hypothetical protein
VRGGYAAPGVHGSGLAPRLEHRATAHGGALESWRETVSANDEALRHYALEDEDSFDLAGYDTVYRRFSHTRAGVHVVCDQWLWLVDGVGHRLQATVAATEYEDYCDVFESVAETFDPHADRRSRSA